MTDKQIINSCEFQSRCIQYKDMYSNKHIKCPIVDFALACRGENKCKYKTVYEQLKVKEQECEELTSKCSQLEEEIKDWQKEVERIQFIGSYGIMDEVKKNTKLEQTLTEIKEIAEFYNNSNMDDICYQDGIYEILQKISECEVENEKT